MILLSDKTYFFFYFHEFDPFLGAFLKYTFPASIFGRVTLLQTRVIVWLMLGVWQAGGEKIFVTVFSATTYHSLLIFCIQH
jgi:hypothetical protein